MYLCPAQRMKKQFSQRKGRVWVEQHAEIQNNGCLPTPTMQIGVVFTAIWCF